MTTEQTKPEKFFKVTIPVGEDPRFSLDHYFSAGANGAYENIWRRLKASLVVSAGRCCRQSERSIPQSELALLKCMVPILLDASSGVCL